MIDGYLGIDLGTQGLSVIFTDRNLKVIAQGEGSYGFVPDLEEGCYEQRTDDWETALRQAMEQIHERLRKEQINVLSIGISGQMHGEVLCDQAGKCLAPVRLWCDGRNGGEAQELTCAFGVKVPRRATAARYLWTARHRPQLARCVRHITTPAGWIGYLLTGKFSLGIGDASGMFPIDAETLGYSQPLLARFDNLLHDSSVPRLGSLLPRIRLAGKDAGKLNNHGADLLGLPKGIPVAAAEGDQVAALAGSLIGDPGKVSCSFVDQFHGADGHSICMVWLINGTTFLNAVVRSYTSFMDKSVLNDDKSTFATVMRHAIEAPDNCGGILALPFIDDEPGLSISDGNSALLLGLNHTNTTPGNVCKAALLSVMFNLRLGQQVLDAQGFSRKELNLSGGLCKTRECAQMLADVFDTPVVVYETADEGCCWGACILAKFRYEQSQSGKSWPEFLNDIAKTLPKHSFMPKAESVVTYETIFKKYQKLVALQPELSKVLI